MWSAVYVDALVLRDRDANELSGDGLEERLYALQDVNFNVAALVVWDGTTAPGMVTTIISTINNEWDVVVGNLLGNSIYNNLIS